jgi:hypothetical protein
MVIYISLKSIGKRKNFITTKEVELTNVPDSLRSLITEIVKTNVRQFNSNPAEVPIVNYLSNTEIEQGASSGKVGFGITYSNNKVNQTEALITAIQAFEDGFYRVFLNDEEVAQLDAPLKVNDGDVVVFIRLTMLAGRMW